MADTLRLFVAVLIPEDVRGRLGAAQERLRAAGAEVSWVKPDNIHLTLKFLGDTDPGALPRIQAALRGVGPQGAFRLTLEGLGAFGGRAPRVVWAGVTVGMQPLAGLAGAVDGVLGRVGIAREKRPFAAHATLGRVRSPRNAEALLAGIQAGRAEDFGEVAVQEFALMQSRLHPQGSIYTPLDRYPLT
jgi:2'-5' RNA ligase